MRSTLLEIYRVEHLLETDQMEHLCWKAGQEERSVGKLIRRNTVLES